MSKCKECDGDGYIVEERQVLPNGAEMEVAFKCKSCGGSGDEED
jgi:DnaJ-class molecular chaperone